jgi:hypothetical protein
VVRGYLRLFYRGWHPTRLGKLVTGALAWVSGLGLTPHLLTLQVKGRRSGQLHDTVLVVAKHDGQPTLPGVAQCAALGVRCRSRALPRVPHRPGVAEPKELYPHSFGELVGSSRLSTSKAHHHGSKQSYNCWRAIRPSRNSRKTAT